MRLHSATRPVCILILTATHCSSCGYPVRAHDPSCPRCRAGLLDPQAEAEALERWERLPEPAKQEFEAGHQRRCREWSEGQVFYEKTSKRKHTLAAAVVFGAAGIFSGWMAVAYALVGALAGRILSRRKGGLFLGTVVGAGVFVTVILTRSLITALVPVDALAALLQAAMTLYPDRILSMLCPAAGAILGLLIEQEFEEKG